MSYIVIKTVKGRRYRYEQRSWREGKRVRTESRYLGPVEGSAALATAPRQRRRRGPLARLAELIAANTLSPEERARLVDEDALLREVKAQEATREKARADFEAKTGMKLGPPNPTPVEKAPPSIDHSVSTVMPEAATQPAAEAATESPAVDAAGQGAGDAAGPESTSD